MGNKLVILGAGPMGLAAGWQAVKRGYDVDILEAGDRPGGMAAHFDFDGLSIERFYHFCCLSDYDTLEILNELGLADKMTWVTTQMGLYFSGRLYQWGNPLALLAFPKLGPIGKLRYGLQVFLATRRKDWSKLDKLNAEQWYVGWLGRRGYERLWKPLIELKFHDESKNVSAAWMWQRMSRLGRSRKSLFEERLGYIEGGSETLMEAMATAIRARGGRIHLGAPAKGILTSEGRVTAVTTADGRTLQCDRVISTIPTPLVPDLLGDDYADLKDQYRRIRNIGVVCVIHKLAKPATKYFWVNVLDSKFQIPGFIEFSRLRPMDKSVVYVPFYMPQSHADFDQPDDFFIDSSWRLLKSVNPRLTDADRLNSKVGRLRYAQPVYEPRFKDILPSVQTPILGLQIADTAFYYPEDRGISESFRLAKVMVGQLEESAQ